MSAGNVEVIRNTLQARKTKTKNSYNGFIGSSENHAKKLGHNFCMQKEVTKVFWQGIILSALAAS